MIHFIYSLEEKETWRKNGNTICVNYLAFIFSEFILLDLLFLVISCFGIGGWGEGRGFVWFSYLLTVGKEKNLRMKQFDNTILWPRSYKSVTVSYIVIFVTLLKAVVEVDIYLSSSWAQDKAMYNQDCSTFMITSFSKAFRTSSASRVQLAFQSTLKCSET